VNKASFFAPLIFFVAGMALLALSTIFYPSIINQANISSAAIGSATMSHYWGLSWGMGSIRLILFMIGLFCVLIGVLIIWVKRKWKGW
jgi:hypothetical protein